MSAPPGSAEKIRGEIRRTIWAYGKIGLLVDDADDARIRIARELYGTEDPPLWWLSVRSIRCLRIALEALWSELQEAPTADPPFWGIAVVDRYLFGACEGDARMPLPWDKEPDADSIYKRLREISEHPSFDRVRSSFIVHLVTSYPHEPAADEVRSSQRSASARPPWVLRSLDLLRQSRTWLDQGESSCLLRYGPERIAPVATHRDEDKIREVFPDLEQRSRARWAARAWSLCIEKLARSLRDRNRSVLVTGAGASVVQGGHGAGTPLPLELIQQALARVPAIGSSVEGRRRFNGPPVVCLCGLPKPPEPSPHLDARVVGSVRRAGSFQELVELLKEGISLASLEWTWEDLFDEAKNQWTPGFEQFQEGFLLALYRHDHGFGHHHWLLARFPWEAMITTNFDGFHERAAFAAAQVPWAEAEQRKQFLRFASPFNPREGRHSSQNLGPMLFKLYGNLSSGRELQAFGPQEREDAADAVGSLRDLIREDPGLVVIGHSMNDRILQQALGWFASRKDAQILWVDPASFSQAAQREPGWWGEQIAIRRKKLDDALDHPDRRSGEGPGLFSGPLPGRAIDFACDLWRAYQRVPP